MFEVFSLLHIVYLKCKVFVHVCGRCLHSRRCQAKSTWQEEHFPVRRDDRILIEVLCLPDPIPSTLFAHFSNIPGKFWLNVKICTLTGAKGLFSWPGSAIAVRAYPKGRQIQTCVVRRPYERWRGHCPFSFWKPCGRCAGCGSFSRT